MIFLCSAFQTDMKDNTTTMTITIYIARTSQSVASESEVRDHVITLRCDLSFHEQVERLASQSAQTMYALRMLRSQGLSGPNLWEVAEATLVSRLSYASQVWWGMIRESERIQLSSVLGRAIKQGFLSPLHPSFSDICDRADHKLFQALLHNPDHVLHQLLPLVKNITYELRPRAHLWCCG